MGDMDKICLLKYGILVAAFVAMFTTQILILKQPVAEMESENYLTEVRFPSFFRTEEQQRMYSNLTKRLQLFDFCCETIRKTESPTTRRDISGTLREMAQFKSKKQFFIQDTCKKTNKNCNCSCAVERTVISAIYVENTIFKKHFIGAFPVDACCKCINIT